MVLFPMPGCSGPLISWDAAGDIHRAVGARPRSSGQVMAGRPFAGAGGHVQVCSEAAGNVKPPGKRGDRVDVAGTEAQRDRASFRAAEVNAPRKW